MHPDTAVTDPSRRALLAALAGGLALAAPGPAKANPTKPKRKRNAPQAVAVVVVKTVGLEANGLVDFAVGGVAKDLRPGATADADLDFVALVRPASAARMRKVLVDTVQRSVADSLGVPEDHVSVLLV